VCVCVRECVCVRACECVCVCVCVCVTSLDIIVSSVGATVDRLCQSACYPGNFVEFNVLREAEERCMG
jgi:hypothetical protein